MSSFLYPKTKRLLKPNDFKYVFDNTLFKIHQPHLMAFITPSKNIDNSIMAEARLGLAITKKKVPTAVARNRIKRKIREKFRHQSKVLPAFDIVVIVKKPVKELTDQQLDQQISQIFSKVISKDPKIS